MRRIFILVAIIAIVSEFSLLAHADLNLIGQGTSAHGTYNLIYDTDLDITWYDYTRSRDFWQPQMDWASSLSVDFGGNTLNEWRLPKTVDAPWSYGYDGTTTAGYNITNSEMGHLYYSELGNKGWYDTSGNMTGCSAVLPYCLTNTGLFENLQPTEMHIYWSGTERSASPNDVWQFSFGFGNLGDAPKDYSDGLYGIAVMDGMAVVPEPISSILFVTGGSFLAGRSLLKKSKKA